MYVNALSSSYGKLIIRQFKVFVRATCDPSYHKCREQPPVTTVHQLLVHSKSIPYRNPYSSSAVCNVLYQQRTLSTNVAETTKQRSVCAQPTMWFLVSTHTSSLFCMFRRTLRLRISYGICRLHRVELLVLFRYRVIYYFLYGVNVVGVLRGTVNGLPTGILQRIGSDRCTVDEWMD